MVKGHERPIAAPNLPRSLHASGMRYEGLLTSGTLLRRYKRFLADVSFANGLTATAHTPNTGSLLGCCEPGSRVWLRDCASPERKYPWSWELVETREGILVGINTGLSNRLVREALDAGRLPQLNGYATVRSEVAYGRRGSRIDFLLEHPERPRCFVEVKNVTAAVSERIAVFPDAVSVRAVKHLEEMADIVRAGERAVLVFCVQREDVTAVRPADEIDPYYGAVLRRAVREGVEVIALRGRVEPFGVELTDSIPVLLDEVIA